MTNIMKEIMTNSNDHIISGFGDKEGKKKNRPHFIIFDLLLL